MNVVENADSAVLSQKTGFSGSLFLNSPTRDEYN